MRIIVAVKQVPVCDSAIHVDSSGKWLEEQDLSFEINEPGAYSLEESLPLKEKHGREVVVLCAGPERAAQTIREALAKGAGRAIHIQSDDFVRLDTFGVARLLAAAIAGEKGSSERSRGLEEYRVPSCRNWRISRLAYARGSATTSEPRPSGSGGANFCKQVLAQHRRFDDAQCYG
jgi:hypothetical protein